MSQHPVMVDKKLLKLTVAGPEHDPLPPADIARLFSDNAVGTARRDRLAHWSRLIAACGETPVAIATYQSAGAELRAPDFGLDVGGCCDIQAVVAAVAHGLEVACLAAGARRVVVMPPKGGEQALRQSGYIAIHEGCAGSWMEKSLT